MAARQKSAPKTRGAIPASTRTPKVASALKVGEDIDREGSKPCWNFRFMDRQYEGEWDWNLTPTEAQTFLQFLSEIQLNTWAEIGR